MPRPCVAIALPAAESTPVAEELRGAGYQVAAVAQPDDLAALLTERRDVAVAILDGETDFDASLEYYGLLHDEGRSIPALMVVSPRAIDRLVARGASAEDEYFTRPYSVDSLRWRVEAMCIRSATVDDGSGQAVIAGDLEMDRAWGERASLLVVFNPKGGVGKTTIATNLAAAIQARDGHRVLLVDADTVTGHIQTSLGLEGGQTLADAWHDELEGEPASAIAALAAEHPSGMRVLALTNSPLHTEVLEPGRVAAAIEAARRAFDIIVVDLHPSYSALNRAFFDIADRILVPVTPDVPALRAAIQLRDVAVDLGIRDRLAMIVNRANSGLGVQDMERTTGMSAVGLIRSGGLLFVHAANEGRTVIERYPKEKVSTDIQTLAGRLIGPDPSALEQPAGSKSGLRIFGRAKEAVRA